MKFYLFVVFAFISSILSPDATYPDPVEPVPITVTAPLNEGHHPDRRAENEAQMLRPVVRLSSYYFPLTSTDMAVYTSATGFSIHYSAVEDQSQILTNHHFCEDATTDGKSILVQTMLPVSDEFNDTTISATGIIEKMNEDLDLCLINVNEYIPPTTLVSPKYRAQPFEELTIVGAPRGVYPIILETHFSNYIDREEISWMADTKGDQFLMISARLEPGHSGSPIFNQDREVIGIVFAGEVRAYGGYGVSNRDILKFLIEG